MKVRLKRAWRGWKAGHALEVDGVGEVAPGVVPEGVDHGAAKAMPDDHQAGATVARLGAFLVLLDELETAQHLGDAAVPDLLRRILAIPER